MDEKGLFLSFSRKRHSFYHLTIGKTSRDERYEIKGSCSLYLCTNTTGALMVPMSIIGTAQNPRYFRKGRPALEYLIQNNASSDSVTFRKWFYCVFLHFARRKTSKAVALVMDNCGPHGADLVDARGQVSIFTLPPNCTSAFQPIDMGVIAASKLRYKSRLLEIMSATIENRDVLREGAKK